MGWLHKLWGWWDRDRAEIAKKEAGMTQAERDAAEEDYESRKDDILAQKQWASGAGAGGVDFERDSERPPR